jgi:hypothetical protein
MNPLHRARTWVPSSGDDSGCKIHGFDAAAEGPSATRSDLLPPAPRRKRFLRSPRVCSAPLTRRVSSARCDYGTRALRCRPKTEWPLREPRSCLPGRLESRLHVILLRIRSVVALKHTEMTVSQASQKVPIFSGLSSKPLTIDKSKSSRNDIERYERSSLAHEPTDRAHSAAGDHLVGAS